MFKLMLELILEDVRANEAKAKAAGKTLTDAQRSAVAAQSVKDLVTFLQETGLLGDVDTRKILQQIEGDPDGIRRVVLAVAAFRRLPAAQDADARPRS